MDSVIPVFIIVLAVLLSTLLTLPKPTQLNLVFVGGPSTVVETSTDGINFTGKASGIVISGNNTGIVYGNRRYVTCNADFSQPYEQIWTSKGPTGAPFTAVTQNNSQQFQNIIYGNKNYFVLTSGSRGYKSTNLKNWTNFSPDVTGSDHLQNTHSKIYIVVGKTGGIYYSTNLTSLSLVTTGGSLCNWTSVSQSPLLQMAVGTPKNSTIVDSIFAVCDVNDVDTWVSRNSNLDFTMINPKVVFYSSSYNCWQIGGLKKGSGSFLYKSEPNYTFSTTNWTWTDVGTALSSQVNTMQQYNGIVGVGCQNGDIFYSTDGSVFQAANRSGSQLTSILANT